MAGIRRGARIARSPSRLSDRGERSVSRLRASTPGAREAERGRSRHRPAPVERVRPKGPMDVFSRRKSQPTGSLPNIASHRSAHESALTVRIADLAGSIMSYETNLLADLGADVVVMSPSPLAPVRTQWDRADDRGRRTRARRRTTARGAPVNRPTTRPEVRQQPVRDTVIARVHRSARSAHVDST